MLVFEALLRGKQLSNTWLTYPTEEDNLGKLRIILHRSGMLKRAQI